MPDVLTIQYPCQMGRDPKPGVNMASRLARAVLVGIATITPSLGYSVVHDSTDDYPARWQQLADKSEAQLATPEGHAYERELVKVHNTFWKQVYEDCAKAARGGSIAKFRAAMVIDAQGKVAQFLPLPQSASLQCFVDKMVGKQYPKPPQAPFYETISITLTSDS